MSKPISGWLLALRFLLPLALPFVGALWGALGQAIAYPRGYLKQGYILGLLLGPLGLLAAWLLPAKAEPLLEVEGELHYGTQDARSHRWKGGQLWAFIALSYAGIVWLNVPGWIPSQASWFETIIEVRHSWPWHALAVLALLALSSWLLLRRAQPPLELLSPLNQHVRRGMEQLAFWAGLRQRIARAQAGLRLHAQLRYRLGAGSVVCLLAMVLAYTSDPSMPLDVPAVLVGLSLLLAALAYYSNRQLRQHGRALRAADQEALAHIQQRDASPILPPILLALNAPRADSARLVALLDDKVLELLRESRGALPGKDATQPVAAATIDARSSALRQLTRPLALAGAGAILFELGFQLLRAFTNALGSSSEPFQYTPDMLPQLLVLGLLVLFVVFLFWYSLSRRQWR